MTGILPIVMTKSPLRYPGGKSKAIKIILKFIKYTSATLNDLLVKDRYLSIYSKVVLLCIIISNDPVNIQISSRFEPIEKLSLAI
jgi:hypothetical protein